MIVVLKYKAFNTTFNMTTQIHNRTTNKLNEVLAKREYFEREWNIRHNSSLVWVTNVKYTDRRIMRTLNLKWHPSKKAWYWKNSSFTNLSSTEEEYKIDLLISTKSI